MKKVLSILIICLSLIGTLTAQSNHYDFCVINPTGYYTYYRIIDIENQLVEVTYPCQNGDNYWYGYERPVGKLIINEEVTYNGTVYHIVAIGDHAYHNCIELRGSLELPQSIENVGDYAFNGCSYLSGTLDLANVKTIGKEAFMNCSNLSGTLDLANVQTIGKKAFMECSNLSDNLILSDSLFVIEDSTFYNCSKLKDRLIVPSSMTQIGKSAFENCGFTGMCMLPASLVMIDENAFKNCSGVNSISIKAENVPLTAASAFTGLSSNIKVYVPFNTYEAYKNAPEWAYFRNIEEKSIWNGKAVEWTKGDGSAENPYLIESAENLAWLAKSVNERITKTVVSGYSPGGAPWTQTYYYDSYVYQDTCFKLVINIDLQREHNMRWTPIGIYNVNRDLRNYFCGIFDGNDHTISDYMINELSDEHDPQTYIGMFGAIDHATICNLKFNHCKVQIQNYDNTKYSGMLAGLARHSLISNCHANGLVRNGYYNNGSYWTNYNSATGSIVGRAVSCRIEKSSSDADVTCVSGNRSNVMQNGVGGIVGSFVCNADDAPTVGIYDCNYTGRLVAYNYNHFYRTVKCGGIVGAVMNPVDSTGVARIEHCFCKGTVKGFGLRSTGKDRITPTSTGGIVGYADNIDTLFVMNCYSNDSVMTNPSSPFEKAYSGGIIGRANPATTLFIKNCYHTGYLEGYNKGGILGLNTNMTIVRNCFYEDGYCYDNGFGMPMKANDMKNEAFVIKLNNGSTIYKMDTAPYQNNRYPVFGIDGLIFVGAEWYYNITNGDGSVTYQHLECVADTTIDSKRVKVIVKSNTLYDKDLDTIVTHEYVYEENGVVYWWNKKLESFTVLYDFSAIEGDEWVISVGTKNITVHVYKTDYQIINGIPYKKLTIGDENDMFSGVIVSTIGHLTSFFPEKMIEDSREFRVEQLRCYWLNGRLKYKTGNDDCSAIYMKYHNITDTSDDIDVYPNPTSDIITIDVENPVEYFITNINGQVVKNGIVSYDSQQVDISNLPNGMYFIKIDNEIIKIIKM